MRQPPISCYALSAVVMLFPLNLLAQERGQTLAVSGYAGNVAVKQIDGKRYVEVEALARLLNGSLRFSGAQVTLTPEPGGHADGASAEANKGFSRAFLTAGIEAMSAIREWHSALESAIENQYPFTPTGFRPFEGRAMKDVRLAQAAAATDSDQKAVPSILKVYESVKALSDKYMAIRANLTYIAPDSLTNDPMNQSIVACGKSLGAMAASGQFSEELACR